MLRTLTVSFLLAVSFCAQSQTPPASQKYTAGKISFNHLGDFTQQQLEDTAGLHVGSSFTADDLTQAAQKLADSGFFDNVGITLDGPFKSITVLFDITPIDHSHLLPVGFENFIWLTPDEVIAIVHSQATLFSGHLPENPAIENSIATALAQALIAKGVANAAVEHETIEPTLQHPLRALEFRVAVPRPVIANIKLAGVTANLVPFIQKSVNTTAKTRYNAGLSGALTSENILEPLLDAGYIEAALTGVNVTSGTPDARTIPVIFSATLVPGEIYKVSALTFAGTPLFSAEAFAATAKLHPGDITSRHALVETFAPLDRAYRMQGYMDVIIDGSPKLDTAAHTVAYNVTVTPGEPYHFQTATAHGLNAANQAAFDAAFARRAGQLYTPDFISFTLNSDPQLRPLVQALKDFKAIADPNTHTVDIVLIFVAVVPR